VLRLPAPDRVPVPARLPEREAVVLRADAVLVVRVAGFAFAPLERDAVAFFAVLRPAPAFAVLRVAVARFAVLRVAVALPRVPLADLVPADLARVPVAALRVLPAAAVRLRVLLAALRVPLAAVEWLEDAAVLRPDAADAALLRLPALARPPFAAAAVRPAAPRAEVPDAFRVPAADFARVPLAAAPLRLLLLRDVVALLRRAGARRRFGVSSACGSPAPSVWGSPCICSVSSLMR
jgi:hypothetical protein